MMGTAPKLRLLSIPVKTEEEEEELTPPLSTSATVPFVWEEEPGKPRAAVPPTPTINTSLELPPRMFKSPSPTTVLHGPYVNKYKPTHFSSESAILLSNRWLSKDKLWFFKRKTTLAAAAAADDDGIINHSFRVSPSDTHDSLYDGDDEDEEEDQWSCSSSRAKLNKNITRTGSSQFLSQSQHHNNKSQFWATIYGGLKQVIPWKPKKLNKNVFVH